MADLEAIKELVQKGDAPGVKALVQAGIDAGDDPQELFFNGLIAGMKIGDTITVSFAPESREYNERWYTDLRAFHIATDGVATAPATQKAPAPVAPASEETDDLPF